MAGADQTAEPTPDLLTAYGGEFLMRAGLLEGSAVTALVLLLPTSFWALFIPAAVGLAGLVVILPSRAKFDAWVEQCRTEAAATADPS